MNPLPVPRPRPKYDPFAAAARRAASPLAPSPSAPATAAPAAAPVAALPCAPTLELPPPSPLLEDEFGVVDDNEDTAPDAFLCPITHVRSCALPPMCALVPDEQACVSKKDCHTLMQTCHLAQYCCGVSNPCVP